MNNDSELILSIEEIHDYELEHKYKGPRNEDYSYNYTSDGFKIKTNKQDIYALISNRQECCETWGYMSTNDNISDFINSKLLGISKTDTCLNTKKLKEKYDPYDEKESDVIFINIETDRGTLQFTLYNSQNGYYGHNIRIISDKLNIDDTL